MNPADPFASCPERQTANLTHGPLTYRAVGTGPAVVFMHGLLGNSRSWVKQFAPFSRTHRVIAWDAPGFGGSAVVEPSVDVFADTLGALLDALECPSAVFVGHSMGGVVAARLAARRPELVSGLVLSCSHAGYGQSADSPPSAKLGSRLKELEALGAEEYGRVRARGMTAKGASAEVLDLAARIATEARPEGMIASSRMLQLADNRALLPGLPMPRMVITGAEDPVVQPAMKDELLALTAGVRHVEIPAVGHAPYLEDAEAFNAAIGEFLAGVAGT